MSYQIGATVRGCFPIECIDAQSRKARQVNLVDHHAVVVAAQGSMLLLAYAGTDNDSANARRPGYIPFPGDMNQALTAGWSVGGKFYIDASRLAIVPANKVTPRGRLVRKLVEQVLSRAGAVHAKPLNYSASDAEVSTHDNSVARNRKMFAAV